MFRKKLKTENDLLLLNNCRDIPLVFLSQIRYDTKGNIVGT